MNRIEQKKTTRRNLSKKHRHDRFISAYIEVKYPEAYDEANTYFDQLNLKYPDKRDLCKTLEFLHTTTGVCSIGEYYHLRRPRNPERKSKKPKQKNNITDNMVLRIPLMDNIDKTTENPPGMEVHESPLVIPDNVYENLVNELRNDPDLYSIFNDMNIADISQEQQVQVTIPDHQDEELQITTMQNIPDHACEGLIQELSQDPLWYDVFNDMDTYENDEQTPLEKELADLGY